MANRENIIILENHFRQFMRKVQSEWSRQVHSELSKSQYLILDKLTTEGPMKVSDLAEAIHITAGAVTGCSDKLIQGEYAERTRDDHDRRVVYLKITEKGTNMMKEITERRKELLTRFFAGVSDDDVIRLTNLFKQIIDNTDPKA
ncbi:transcriptional regulator [Paenibacillus selenitireducens]|uniref:Transcriptional regulator n=1 Tax=Paenibacillus selenitireducens TaxID=1324314 RepID=A0A1T2X371_9BACL|nr:MarR family transcriptional regulator [Paenibacillus selenitireducens]OPA74310.1 transcriptional regulator [Paenibacillus selenitireducens]